MWLLCGLPFGSLFSTSHYSPSFVSLLGRWLRFYCLLCVCTSWCLLEKCVPSRKSALSLQFLPSCVTLFGLFLLGVRGWRVGHEQFPSETDQGLLEHHSGWCRSPFAMISALSSWRVLVVCSALVEERKGRCWNFGGGGAVFPFSFLLLACFGADMLWVARSLALFSVLQWTLFLLQSNTWRQKIK